MDGVSSQTEIDGSEEELASRRAWPLSQSAAFESLKLRRGADSLHRQGCLGEDPDSESFARSAAAPHLALAGRRFAPSSSAKTPPVLPLLQEPSTSERKKTLCRGRMFPAPLCPTARVASLFLNAETKPTTVSAARWSVF